MNISAVNNVYLEIYPLSRVSGKVEPVPPVPKITQNNTGKVENTEYRNSQQQNKVNSPNPEYSRNAPVTRQSDTSKTSLELKSEQTVAKPDSPEAVTAQKQSVKTQETSSPAPGKGFYITIAGGNSGEQGNLRSRLLSGGRSILERYQYLKRKEPGLLVDLVF